MNTCIIAISNYFNKDRSNKYAQNNIRCFWHTWTIFKQIQIPVKEVQLKSIKGKILRVSSLSHNKHIILILFHFICFHAITVKLNKFDYLC